MNDQSVDVEIDENYKFAMNMKHKQDEHETSA